MGKSAKFTKRPSRKEKLGLSSSNASHLKAARLAPLHAVSKPQHRPIAPPKAPEASTSHPLIEEPQDDAMEEDEEDGAGQGRKKKAGLKAKVARQSGKAKGVEGTPASGDAGKETKKRDYVDLFDKPHRRKSKAKMP